MTRGSERLQAGVNESSVRANAIRAACHSMFFLATAPASTVLIADEPLTTDMVPVLSELTPGVSSGSLILMSITVRSRFVSLDAISGPAATGT